MIQLPIETEALARKIAAVRGLSLEDVVSSAIEESAQAAGILRPRRRMTVEQMLALGDEIAAMPLLDSRTPGEIMEDLNVR